jgi:site-specific DNA recombinase
MFANPIFIGRVRHHDQSYAGEHEAIVERSLWDEVQAALAVNHRTRGNQARATTPALLRGIIRCGHCDANMTTTFTKKRDRVYRYYLCGHAAKNGRDSCPVKTIPVGNVEQAALEQVRGVLRSPEVRGEALRIIQAREAEMLEQLNTEKAGLEGDVATLKASESRMVQGSLGQGGSSFVNEELVRMEAQVAQATERISTIAAELEQLAERPTTQDLLTAELETFDRIWDELIPAEKERLVHLIVERVTVYEDGLDIVLRANGVDSLVGELAGCADEPVEAEDMEVAHG